MIDSQAGKQLLLVARSTLSLHVERREQYVPQEGAVAEALLGTGSSFVTLTNRGRLRGCIGTIQARLPLIWDVMRNTIAAARDPRFEPVQAWELLDIAIEISVLQPARSLDYVNYKDLLGRLQPGLDGVIVSWQQQRALLLPQVWTRLPQPERFLQALCQKAKIPWRLIGASPPQVKVATFAVSSFCEPSRESAPKRDDAL